MVRETTSQSLKRRCLSPGRILSYIYLLSPATRLSDAVCDVLVVTLNSLPVTTLLETRASLWETRGTQHYPDLSGNDNNPNSFQPLQRYEFDIHTKLFMLLSHGKAQVRPRLVEGGRALTECRDIYHIRT